VEAARGIDIDIFTTGVGLQDGGKLGEKSHRSYDGLAKAQGMTRIYSSAVSLSYVGE
jgi:hypothetical protein